MGAMAKPTKSTTKHSNSPQTTKNLSTHRPHRPNAHSRKSSTHVGSTSKSKAKAKATKVSVAAGKSTTQVSKKTGKGRGSHSLSQTQSNSLASSQASTLTTSTTYAQNKAGANLFEVLGGREHILSILEDSSHPKADKLADRLRSSVHQNERFSTAYGSVGLKAHEIVEIFSDVQQARVLINAISQADDVMRSLIRAAADQLESHGKCEGTGRLIDRTTHQPVEPEQECRQCHGTGYLLIAGDKSSQELYFEMIKWRKSGAMINLDNRRQTVNFPGGPQPPGGFGFLPGAAPEVMQIVRRAETLSLPPGSDEDGIQMSNAQGMPDGDMPDEDNVMEPELVGNEL
jgi:hypothetical protein